MLKKKTNWTRKVQIIFFALGFVFVGQAMADVAPPKGQVRIGAIYMISPPKTQPKEHFLLVETSQRDPAHLRLMPFDWGRPITPNTCYRCETRLVALAGTQGEKLMGLLAKHPTVAINKKMAQKLQGPAKMQWISRISFNALTEKAQTPAAKPLTLAVVTFFQKEKYAKSPALSSKVVVDQKHKGNIQMAMYSVVKINGAAIEWKLAKKTLRRDPKAKGMKPTRRRSRISLARNPWFYGTVMLLLLAVFFTTRNRR